VPNHLANENSPYLLQHAENPVDWYPWGPEALDKARREGKPIFLSIGYAACHWCHVMAHESFEDPETAAIMNAGFVNIKVDREERPDLDGIYMNAVVAMTGQGGWPMSVFLTPDGQPFYGGTYFPPVRRYNMPAFRDLLLSISKAWVEDRQNLLEAGEKLTAHLQKTALPSTGKIGQIDHAALEAALERASLALAQSYDWVNGGWGRAPKFPQPMAIRFLLRRATRGDKLALEIATHALRAMTKGGMYDVVGGGFARYSVDDRWLVPHFEKMLYDNAQLAQVYLHAYLVTKDDFFRRICEGTLAFVAREMTHPEGGFFSSLDADSEGREGKYYLWTLEELEGILSPDDLEFFSTAYGITPEGNFEGHTVLQRALDDEKLADCFRIAPEQAVERLGVLHTALLDARAQRVRPATDDKVLVSWNGLMLSAFAEAGRYLRNPAFTCTAIRNGAFLIEKLRLGECLQRSLREGSAKHNAYLEDYASLINGLLALYQTDPDPRWYQAALGLAEELLAHFRDENGGFFDTRADHEALIVRPKDLQDNATPCGNSLAAAALLKLAAYTGNGEWHDKAVELLPSLLELAVRHPTAFGGWLCAMDMALGPIQEVAILGNSEEPGAQALIGALWGELRPNLVAAISGYPPAEGAPPLLADRPLLNDQATAYVCLGFVCKQPVNRPEELAKQLSEAAKE